MTKSDGSCEYPNGAAYSGQWNGEGEKHGNGTLTFKDGSKYTGQFSCGVSSGFGVMQSYDGSVYVNSTKIIM